MILDKISLEAYIETDGIFLLHSGEKTYACKLCDKPRIDLNIEKGKKGWWLQMPSSNIKIILTIPGLKIPRESLKELLLTDPNCSHVQRVKANYIEAILKILVLTIPSLKT